MALGNVDGEKTVYFSSVVEMSIPTGSGQTVLIESPPQSIAVSLDHVSQYVADTLREKGSDSDGINCYSVALQRKSIHMVEDEARYYVKRDYTPTTREALKPGDIMVFDNYDHMAMYVGDVDGVQMVLHKANWKHQSKFEVVPMADAMLRSYQAHFHYVVDKWDKIGQKEPTAAEVRPYKVEYYTPAFDRMPDVDMAMTMLAAPYHPQLQFHALRLAAIIGVSPFVRPYLTMIESAGYMLRKVEAAIDFNSHATENLLALPAYMAETMLSLKSLIQQVELSLDQYDPITERNVQWRMPEVYKTRFITSDKALHAELLLYAIALGTPPDKISEVVENAKAEIMETYTSKSQRPLDTWTAKSAAVDVHPFVAKEVEKVRSRTIRAELDLLETGATLILSPADVMADPFGVQKMLGDHGEVGRIVLQPLEHAVFMGALKTLVTDRSPDKIEDIPNVERVRAAIEKAGLTLKKAEKF